MFECAALDCSRVEKRLPDDAHDARVLPQEAPNDAHDARLLAWIGIQEAPNDVPDVRLLAPSGTHDIPNDAYDHASASAKPHGFSSTPSLIQPPPEFRCRLRLRKVHGDAAAVRAVPTRQEQRNYCQMVTAFAHHHNLPLPATGRSGKDSSSTTEWTDTQAEYLNFLEALIVRFKRLWVPRASATRLGAAAILSDNRFRSKRIGQWTHLLDRSSLFYWQAAPR